MFPARVWIRRLTKSKNEHGYSQVDFNAASDAELGRYVVRCRRDHGR